MSLRAMLRGRGWMLALAALLGLAALLMPPVPQTRSVYEHVVVFDVTQSMNVPDMDAGGKPVSRIAFARAALIGALDELPCGSKIGLAAFANRKALMLLSPVEVCANRHELTQAIEQIDVRMAWEHASLVARGAFAAVGMATEWPKPPSLMFITDGHEAPPINDGDIPEFIKPVAGVRGTLFGVGGSTPHPIPLTDREGRQIGWWSADKVVQRRAGAPGSSNEHLSALNEAHLKAVATATGLRYARLDAARAMRDALTDGAHARSQVVPTDMRWLPALLAGLLMAAFHLPGSAAARPRTDVAGARFGALASGLRRRPKPG